MNGAVIVMLGGMDGKEYGALHAAAAAVGYAMDAGKSTILFMYLVKNFTSFKSFYMV